MNEQQASGTTVRDRRQVERTRALPAPSDALPTHGGHGYLPAAPGSIAHPEPVATSLAIDAISGVVLDARDLAATRRFYSIVFRDSPGSWQEENRRLIYATSDQRVEFVRRPRPRTIAHAGQHVAYRVPADRLRAIAEALAAAGAEVSWWREDHPSERELTAYAADPSGNVVQLVGSRDLAGLIDHYYVAVEDIEHGELFYGQGAAGAG